MENYKLISLKVKGFRGFPDRAGEREFLFDNSCTLLLGIQGGAKSSTLNAIEWCLFGDKVANKSGTKIDERKDWLVKNKTSSEATVEVTFERDDGELLKVYRCDRKRRGKPSFYYQINDGIHEDENRSAVLLGVELSDYMSCIYLHQEVINALLVQEPKERRNALDRLMGLTNWRNLAEGIKNAKATDQFKKIDEDYAQIHHKIETAKKIKQGDLATAKEEAISHEIAEKELTLDGAKSRCQTVAETMQRFANDYSLLLPMRILNKGDINCAALSIFLGLATSNNLTHNINFMVLDDPSQNLDPAHKERLAGVLNDVLKNKQLIIATSEDDFATHLNSKLTKPKKVYRLEGWTEDAGPCIRVE